MAVTLCGPQWSIWRRPMFNKADMVTKGSVAPSGDAPRKISKVSLLIRAFQFEDLSLIPDNLDQILATDDGTPAETTGTQDPQPDSADSEDKQGKKFDMRKLKDSMTVKQEKADPELEGETKKFDIRKLKDGMKTTSVPETPSGIQKEDKTKKTKILSTIMEEPEIMYSIKKRVNMSMGISRIASIHPPRGQKQVQPRNSAFRFLPLPPEPESAIKPHMINVPPEWLLNTDTSSDDPSVIYDDIREDTATESA